MIRTTSGAVCENNAIGTDSMASGEAKRNGDSTSNHRASACHVMGENVFSINDAVLTCRTHGNIQ
jgi:hypothetical protein